MYTRSYTYSWFLFLGLMIDDLLKFYFCIMIFLCLHSEQVVDNWLLNATQENMERVVQSMIKDWAGKKNAVFGQITFKEP